MTHCFHAYTCRIYRHVFRTCIRISEKLGSLSNTSASYSLSVRQASALLSASFRPLVTKTPLLSCYFLPHVGLKQWTFTTSSAPCRAHQQKSRAFCPTFLLSLNGLEANQGFRKLFSIEGLQVFDRLTDTDKVNRKGIFGSHTANSHQNATLGRSVQLRDD